MTLKSMGGVVDTICSTLRLLSGVLASCMHQGVQGEGMRSMWCRSSEERERHRG